MDGLGRIKMEVELVNGASHPFDLEAFLAGKQTPVFFGSAISNFGVRELLAALAEYGSRQRRYGLTGAQAQGANFAPGEDRY